MKRQTTPLLIPVGSKGAARPLTQESLRAPNKYDERWIQELIHHHPGVLPIASMEPAFWPAVPICMELPLRSGFLDNLLVTPLGDLIAVECKLWRNGEARREVIAQIIDYAKDLQALDYSGLEEAVRRARREPACGLFNIAAAGSMSMEEPEFVDTVSRNLRRGRCLLLIVGDGITENAESMAEFLQQHAGLHFALALVQLAVYQLPSPADDLIVVPSVPMRTVNVTRGIVQIVDGQPVVAGTSASPRAMQANTLTEEEMFTALDRLRPGTSDRLLIFLKDCEDLNVTWQIRKTLIVRMNVGERSVPPFVINADGLVDTGYTERLNRKDLIRPFAEKLAASIPGAIVRESPKTILARMPDRMFTVQELLDHATGCRAALEVLHSTLVEDEQRVA